MRTKLGLDDKIKDASYRPLAGVINDIQSTCLTFSTKWDIRHLCTPDYMAPSADVTEAVARELVYNLAVIYSEDE